MSLPPLPDDPSNAYDTDPRAARLGKKIFFDTRFSANGTVSCGTCHQADKDFQDGLPLAHGMGTTDRRTMPLIGNAYLPWLFWDGRKDSLWSQALGPPEAPREHGISRTMCALIISAHYAEEYEAIFGPLPELDEQTCPALARPDPKDPEAYAAPQERRDAINRVYANMGKAIAAYVRLIVPGPSRFDRYVEALAAGDRQAMELALKPAEARGLRLFIGKAACTNCHSGPLLSNGEFHNVGVPQPPSLPQDRGRAEGIRDVNADLFNCLGKWSDAGPGDCAELRFMDTRTEDYEGAFKTPTLRNVARRPPFMHAGQLATLGEVLRHYRDVRPGGRVSPELEHADLTDEELSDLEAFLGALTGPLRSASEEIGIMP